MPWVSNVLQMKEEAVLKFVAAGTHLVGNNLDFQMEQSSTKAKWHLPHKSEENRGDASSSSLCHCCCWTPADSSIISSRNTGQQAVVKFAAATRATPITDRLTAGTFTNQIQAAFHEPRLLAATVPRAHHRPLTEALMWTRPPSPCATDSPLRPVDTAKIPGQQQESPLGVLTWWTLARNVLRMRGTISRDHPWEISPISTSGRDGKEEHTAAGKAVTEGDFKGEWSAPAPKLTTTAPEVTDGSEGAGALCAHPAVPHWRPSLSRQRGLSAAPTALATEWVGTTTEWA